MTHSESVKELAAALSKAQGMIKSAPKDSKNEHFRSSYSSLASIWDACRESLTANGLSVLQPASASGKTATITTMLVHTSGEWVSEALTLEARDASPQSIGSAITYGRRYGLAAMVGIASDDDDGEAAHGRGPDQQAQRPQPEQAPRKPPQRPVQAPANHSAPAHSNGNGVAKAEPQRDPRSYADLSRDGVAKVVAQFKGEFPKEDREVVNGFQLNRHLLKAAGEAKVIPTVKEPGKLKEVEVTKLLSDLYATPDGYRWVRGEMAAYLESCLDRVRKAMQFEEQGDPDLEEAVEPGSRG